MLLEELYVVDTLIALILQMRKLRNRAFKITGYR
jgi:hypothetical protein